MDNEFLGLFFFLLGILLMGGVVTAAWLNQRKPSVIVGVKQEEGGVYTLIDDPGKTRLESITNWLFNAFLKVCIFGFGFIIGAIIF